MEVLKLDESEKSLMRMLNLEMWVSHLENEYRSKMIDMFCSTCKEKYKDGEIDCNECDVMCWD